MSNVHIGKEQLRLVREIEDEAKRIYRGKYGRRNPATLSTLELDGIRTEAGKIVNRRRGLK